ncbi:glycosyl transferase family 1 [Pedobacter paludis]|uniref:Glycosyl transferase family 1 n=1 Tax=Pedobacter paludis TaxID=2203212 RepID=A0A317F1I7_9SPHI|nr:glycosyl transferase family 1 [Pedobacter paludis]
MKRLAIITTHPIQYYAPAFRLLAKGIILKVFYTGGRQLVNQFDKGFNKKIEWDIPLLEGYDYEFLENHAKDPGTHHFKGISSPKAIENITDYKPDSILVFGWAFQSHLRIIRHFKGKVPVYFRGDSTLIDQKFGIKSNLKKIFISWVYHHIDIAFYVGKKNKSYFKRYGLTDKKLRFSPHAIDNDRFSIDRKKDAAEIRKTLKIGQNDLLILFAGKLESKKNPELLLHAFFELDLPNVHLLFVGNGELEESLKLKVESLEQKSEVGSPKFEEPVSIKDLNTPNVLRRAQDHIEVQSSKFKVQSLVFIPSPPSSTSGCSKSLKERIHFMDFQNQTQMPAVYQACDLFCLPSKGPGETWGLAVNEAMATGKAILVSDKAGCSADLVKPHLNGEIFISGNLKDLKDKLLTTLSNKNILIEYGKASKKIIEDWSFEKQVNSFLKTINS